LLVGDIAGGASLYLGSANGLITSAPIVINHESDADMTFGYSVYGVGDTDGDGYPDVIVGEGLGNGSVSYVYRGGPLGLNTTGQRIVVPPDPALRSFTPAFSGVDVNGDGFADVLFSGATALGNGNSGTSMYVILGSPSGPTTPVKIENPAGVSYTWIAGGLGDVNRDGFGDLAFVSLDLERGNPNDPYVVLGGSANFTLLPVINTP
jgi:hypothetical protein